MTLIINLFGAPSAGKSTMMALVFAKLKLKGCNVEMAPEYVKRKVWENSMDVLSDQLYILGKQYHSMHILQDKVDVVITDSPILLTLLYADNCLDKEILDSYEELTLNIFNNMNNLNVFLKRTKKYNPHGRTQTEAESDELSTKTNDLLWQYDIKYHTLESSEKGADELVEMIIEILNIEVD